MTLRVHAGSLLQAAVLAVVTMHAAASTVPTPVAADVVSSIRQIASLDDAIFGSATVREGQRDPAEFQRAAGGLYLLGPYSSDRLPVIFIHGINGSPRDFRYLVDRLDQERFQVCVYFYASSGALDTATRQLASEIAELASHHDVRSIAIVAHSMGGLIARQLIVDELQPTDVTVPLLITLSTPWQGNAAAAVGARLMPGTLAWQDVATGSEYLLNLFEAASGGAKYLPERTQHHLLFSYRKSWIFLGPSSDQVVSLSSQLSEPAQEQASRTYGFDTTHVGILKNVGVATLLNQLLESVFDVNSPLPIIITDATTTDVAS
jgi:pimeloyl-ACP methyl ester carboxylesterase